MYVHTVQTPGGRTVGARFARWIHTQVSVQHLTTYISAQGQYSIPRARYARSLALLVSIPGTVRAIRTNKGIHPVPAPRARKSVMSAIAHGLRCCLETWTPRPASQLNMIAAILRTSCCIYVLRSTNEHEPPPQWVAETKSSSVRHPIRIFSCTVTHALVLVSPTLPH